MKLQLLIAYKSPEVGITDEEYAEFLRLQDEDPYEAADYLTELIDRETDTEEDEYPVGTEEVTHAIIDGNRVFVCQDIIEEDDDEEAE